MLSLTHGNVNLDQFRLVLRQAAAEAEVLVAPDLLEHAKDNGWPATVIHATERLAYYFLRELLYDEDTRKSQDAARSAIQACTADIDGDDVPDTGGRSFSIRFTGFRDNSQGPNLDRARENAERGRYS